MKCFIFLVLAVLLCSCQEQFLDKKPQQSLLVPRTVRDYQALLDNANSLMNVAPFLPLAADGDFRVSETGWNNLAQPVRSTYLWSDEIAGQLSDWDIPYKQVFTCNVVLEGLEGLSEENQSRAYRNLKGSALFFRALAFYNLSQQFAAPYDQARATALAGIPLSLSSDINLLMPRASLETTYAQILADLEAARPLLDQTPQLLTRPSQVAVCALLARIYLSMQDYSSALGQASLALAEKKTLLDYNTLKTGSSLPFPVTLNVPNPEVIFYLRANNTFLANQAVFADSALIGGYDDLDLRKQLFFTGQLQFKGSYTGTIYPFQGLSTDELYLIRAECLARSGELAAAVQLLDELLQTRWVKGAFVPHAAGSQQQVLNLILSERRKQLVGRGLRWSDLRRLNQDPQFAQTLKRTFSSQVYMLKPGDKRYLFRIPLDEIATHDIAQNP